MDVSYCDEDGWALADPGDLRRAGIDMSQALTWQAVKIPTFNVWMMRLLRAEWMAVYRLVIQDGAFAVAEVRIYPREDFNYPKDDKQAPLPLLGVWSGEWRGIDAKAPAGGITGNLIREAAMVGPSLISGLTILQNLHRKASAAGHRSAIVDNSLAKRGLRVLRPARAPKPKHPRTRPLGFYEKAAKEYTQAVRREAYPNRAVAKALNVTPSQARDVISRARKLGLLPQTSRGKARAD